MSLHKDVISRNWRHSQDIYSNLIIGTGKPGFMPVTTHLDAVLNWIIL
jgi:hypothetical protein